MLRLFYLHCELECILRILRLVEIFRSLEIYVCLPQLPFRAQMSQTRSILFSRHMYTLGEESQE